MLCFHVITVLYNSLAAQSTVLRCCFVMEAFSFRLSRALFLLLSLKSDMVSYSLKRGNSTIFSYTPDDSAALTAVRASRVMLCGMTPTFDRYEPDSPMLQFTDVVAILVTSKPKK